jgi:protein ImuB
MTAVFSNAPSPPPRVTTAGRRYLALCFPFLPCERMRAQTRRDGDGPAEATRAGAPLVLVDRAGGGLRIVAVDCVAARLGLAPGLALADARARVPRLDVAPLDAAADAALLGRLAVACGLYTPLVARAGADALVLDVTGCAHLFGGEAGLVEAATARMRRFGLTACAALAGAPEAALALARHTPGRVVPPGGELAALSPLPVAALDLDPAVTLALTRAGLRSLGDLDARQSAALAARFGAALVDRLDRLLGRRDVRITPLRAPPELMAERHFAEPIARLEDVTDALARLTQDLCEALEARGRGARRLEATFFRADGVTRRLALRAAAPTREAATLMRLMKLELERLADPLDPGYGFDALRLAVTRSETLAPAQTRLDGEAERQAGEKALAELVGRLAARFGGERVMRFAPCDTHDPVRAAVRVPALGVDTPPARWPEPPPGEPPLRPLTLFATPQPIEVVAETPDGPPLRFRWRRVLHQTMRAEGPERIAPEWWRADAAPATRDYYRVEDAQGRRFWLFREGFYDDPGAPPRWRLHGLFA